MWLQALRPGRLAKALIIVLGLELAYELKPSTSSYRNLGARSSSGPSIVTFKAIMASEISAWFILKLVFALEWLA